ncbi:MAG: alpha/beta hydrolase [Actinomycetes bacterium]
MSLDHDLTLPGDRNVRARAVGPSDAPVIVYFHGTPDSRLTIDICAEQLSSAPARLIAFDRPGYGGSDFQPFSFASVAEDTRAVMDEFGVERFAVLGLSGGGPFALSCAAHLPDRVSAVGVASGPASSASVPSARAELIDTDQQALDLIGTDDAQAARLFATGFGDMATLPQQDDDTVIAALHALLPADGPVLSRPGIAVGVTASMREALRQGVEGCAWDNVAWVGPWQFDVTAVHQPTWLWYGLADPLSPPANGTWLKEQLPHAELVIREGEGHLGIYTHWDEIVTALTSRH